MDTLDKYDVFVSYAWEDKDSFVRPLVDQLIASGLKVWFDELALTLGDSLSATIDKGLSSSRYGVVVLSPAFFSRSWPGRELSGLVQKAMGEKRKVILPVWHGLSREQVASQSLPLADLLAVDSAKGVEAVAQQIAMAVNQITGDGVGQVLASHQLSLEKLLASAKRIVADPMQVVGVRELADAIGRDCFTNLSVINEAQATATPNREYLELAAEYRRITRPALAFCALAANLGDPAHFPSVVRVFKIVTRDTARDLPASHLPAGIAQYPAAWLVYAVCLSALQQKRTDLVLAILLDVEHVGPMLASKMPLLHFIEWHKVSDCLKGCYVTSAGQTYKTPLSEHMRADLFDPIGDYFVDRLEYERIFDQFEYLQALVFASFLLRAGQGDIYVPVGRYMWAYRLDRPRMTELESEVENLGVISKVFSGNTDWLAQVKALIERVSQGSLWR